MGLIVFVAVLFLDISKLISLAIVVTAIKWSELTQIIMQTINPSGFLLIFASANSRTSVIVHLLDSSVKADLLPFISVFIHLICCPIRVIFWLIPMAKCFKADYLVVVIFAAGNKTVLIAAKFLMFRKGIISWDRKRKVLEWIGVAGWIKMDAKAANQKP